jgi:hypothetical protein
MAFGQVKIGQGQLKSWNRLISFMKINHTGNLAAARQELRQIVAGAHDRRCQGRRIIRR